MHRPTRRVSLELRTREGPPAGVARGEDGEPREFSGWLGLICALDGLLSGHTPRTEMEDEDVDHTTHRA
jgi:hypothetical protein